MIITFLIDLSLPKSDDENKIIEKILLKEETSGIVFDEICYTKSVFDDLVVINVISFESTLAVLRQNIRELVEECEHQNVNELLRTRTVLLGIESDLSE